MRCFTFNTSKCVVCAPHPVVITTTCARRWARIGAPTKSDSQASSHLPLRLLSWSVDMSESASYPHLLRAWMADRHHSIGSDGQATFNKHPPLLPTTNYVLRRRQPIEERRRKIAHMIQTLRPDVLCLQDADEKLVQKISSLAWTECTNQWTTIRWQYRPVISNQNVNVPAISTCSGLSPGRPVGLLQSWVKYPSSVDAVGCETENANHRNHRVDVSPVRLWAISNAVNALPFLSFAVTPVELHFVPSFSETTDDKCLSSAHGEGSTDARSPGPTTRLRRLSSTNVLISNVDLTPIVPDGAFDLERKHDHTRRRADEKSSQSEAALRQREAILSQIASFGGPGPSFGGPSSSDAGSSSTAMMKTTAGSEDRYRQWRSVLRPPDVIVGNVHLPLQWPQQHRNTTNNKRGGDEWNSSKKRLSSVMPDYVDAWQHAGSHDRHEQTGTITRIGADDDARPKPLQGGSAFLLEEGSLMNNGYLVVCDDRLEAKERIEGNTTAVATDETSAETSLSPPPIQKRDPTGKGRHDAAKGKVKGNRYSRCFLWQPTNSPIRLATFGTISPMISKECSCSDQLPIITTMNVTV